MGLLIYLGLSIGIPCLIAAATMFLIHKLFPRMAKGEKLETGKLWLIGFLIWVSVFLLGRYPIVICPPELEPTVTKEMKADIRYRIKSNMSVVPTYVIFMTDATYVEYSTSGIVDTYVEGYAVNLLTMQKVYGSLHRYGTSEGSAGWSEPLFG